MRRTTPTRFVSITSSSCDRGCSTTGPTRLKPAGWRGVGSDVEWPGVARGGAELTQVMGAPHSATKCDSPPGLLLLLLLFPAEGPSHLHC